MNQQIIRLYQTNKLFLFPAIVAISSLILIIFVIYPQAVKLITTKKVEGDIFNKSQFLASKAQALENYDVTDLNNQVYFALGFYPTDREVVSILGLLQKITSATGFSTLSMSLGGGLNQGEKNQYQSYSVKLELSGSAQFLPILLSNLEASQRLMRVSSLDVTLGKDPKEASISLVVDVLYASPPTDLGTIDSPLPSLSEKDQEIIAKITRMGIQPTPGQPSTNLGPRGKANPFE